MNSNQLTLEPIGLFNYRTLPVTKLTLRFGVFFPDNLLTYACTPLHQILHIIYEIPHWFLMDIHLNLLLRNILLHITVHLGTLHYAYFLYCDFSTYILLSLCSTTLIRFPYFMHIFLSFTSLVVWHLFPFHFHYFILLNHFLFYFSLHIYVFPTINTGTPHSHASPSPLNISILHFYHLFFSLQ